MSKTLKQTDQAPAHVAAGRASGPYYVSGPNALGNWEVLGCKPRLAGLTSEGEARKLALWMNKAWSVGNAGHAALVADNAALREALQSITTAIAESTQAAWFRNEIAQARAALAGRREAKA